MLSTLATGTMPDSRRRELTANGAIVLVHTKMLATWEDLADEYRIDPPIIDRAKKAGAAAIFWMATRPDLLLYRHTSALDGQLAVRSAGDRGAGGCGANGALPGLRGKRSASISICRTM